MCCPPNNVIKSDSKRFLAIGELHEDKLCDTLQAMAPTNVISMVHQTSLPHVKSNLDRLGLMSPNVGNGSANGVRDAVCRLCGGSVHVASWAYQDDGRRSLKKNLNASKPPELSPSGGMSKGLDGNIGCRDKNYS